MEMINRFAVQRPESRASWFRGELAKWLEQLDLQLQMNIHFRLLRSGRDSKYFQEKRTHS